ncbi:dihydrofolate reductase motif-containing protein [Pandoravirus inopinatum]|uniref:Dihydrofolate reductase motif-containing protein n=1 Tax=Pandoravirus inopinatum TaxID=1605721 RepID=A0A0B5J7S3_9VIRU|nr:dihydrofolate reductase motif-containing protein [Pandoravirus inopinatum]AJF96811.1 dihydrofolate reductase motif-containing protein [Pandoravirus inopinatum]
MQKKVCTRSQRDRPHVQCCHPPRAKTFLFEKHKIVNLGDALFRDWFLYFWHILFCFLGRLYVAAAGGRSAHKGSVLAPRPRILSGLTNGVVSQHPQTRKQNTELQAPDVCPESHWAGACIGFFLGRHTFCLCWQPQEQKKGVCAPRRPRKIELKKKDRRAKNISMESAQTAASDVGDGDTRKGLPAVHIVACTDSNDAITVDGVLPWAFRAADQRDAIDAIVKDAPIVIGARSTSVFGGAPPGARVIILSRSGTLPVGAWARAHVVQSPEAALAMCADEPVLYVLGGASTFAAFVPYAAVVHRIVVAGHTVRPWPQEAAIVHFPWLGRAGGRTTVCGPLVAGRGGCSHQVRSDTLAPVDRAPPPPPPADPLVDDPDLEQAKMLSFYEHAMRSATAAPPPRLSPWSANVCGSATTIADGVRNKVANTDDLDWCAYEDDGSDDYDDDDGIAADSDEDDWRTGKDDTNGSDDDSAFGRSEEEGDNSLSARRPTPWSGPRRPPRGCMVASWGAAMSRWLRRSSRGSIGATSCPCGTRRRARALSWSTFSRPDRHRPVTPWCTSTMSAASPSARLPPA